MKYQLFILSALLVSAFALPVPDEEVSPVQPAVVPEVAIPLEKGAEDVKPVLRAAAPAEAASLPVAEKKIDLPANAPDAEIAQAAPIKKEELKEALKEELKAEIKEEEKKSEKQIRADDQPEEIKALPVVQALSAGTDEQKPLVGDVKSASIDSQLAGQSAIVEAPASENKKEELSASEGTPAIKSDKPAEVIAEAASAPVAKPAEEKKEDLPARQERENQKNSVDTEIQTHVPSSAPAIAAPEVKSLAPESIDAVKLESAAPAAEVIAAPALKSGLELEEKKAEVLPAAAGDISKQSSEESNLKALNAEAEKPKESQPEAAHAQHALESNANAPEGKKIEDAAPAVPVAAALTPAEEEKKEEAKEPLAAESGEPLKKLEDKKPAAEEKPAKSDKKKSEESKESDESKESEESKESKSN